MAAKIAIFNWGELSVHAYYLAEQLCNDGIEVDFYLYTPTYANKKFYSKTLIANLKNKSLSLIEIRCTEFEKKLIRLNKIAELLKRPLPAIFTNPFLPLRTRKFFKSKKYNYIITITPSSLYWLYKTDRSCLKKVIHYSLEIEQITDPNIKKDSIQYTLIKKETKLLQSVKGLIIQDKLRANVLLHNVTSNNLTLFYIPVSIPGEIVETRDAYLHKKFGLPSRQKIILYFGAVYQERKIDELTDAFANIIEPDWVLILHGGGEFSKLAKTENIKTSNMLLEYDDLHLIISSATIGIAFYNNGWPNTRLTAFSSEKIARYLQAGVPFIALTNESYVALKNEFDCCELIEDVDELEYAISKILNDYDRYRTNSFKAYNTYYNIQHSIKPLTDFILNDK